MGLRIRFQSPTAASLGYSIERLADGSLFDFADSTFKAAPGTITSPLAEDSGLFAGRYRATLAPTPSSQFVDGDYAITVHDLTSRLVVGQLGAAMHAGDDATVFPGLGGSPGPDPWSASLPGGYAPGTAGAILGQNLDARVSSRSTFAGGAVASVAAPVTVGVNNDKAGYGLSQAFPANFAALAIGSGGVVTAAGGNGPTVQQIAAAILTNPSNLLATDVAGRVSAATVADKSGYSLAPNGLDSIVVEAGINLRQAISPILAASAGVLSGASTGAIVIRGANVATTRITATTDNAGNRSSVTLSLPA